MGTDSREDAEPTTDGTASPGADATKSKNELYEEARDAGIEGRSATNREQLVGALRRHRATSVRREPAPRQAPRPRPHTGHHSRSRPGPEGEIASANVARPSADVRGPDRCAIVFEGSGPYGEFHVVVTESDGSRRSVARSPAFRRRRFGRLRRRGPARVAHELLVTRLEACGWWPVDSGGPWHDLHFVRLPGEGTRSRRSLVTLVREAGEARFAAEELDSYGNPAPLAVSEPFGAPRFRRVRPSTQAKAALRQLVKRMEAEGWKAAVGVGDDWYSISLRRPASTAPA
jgi:hypothetical protein